MLVGIDSYSFHRYFGEIYGDGLQVDPGAELLWRDALKAEWLAGDLAGLTNTADRLSALADELGDDLEPDTVELLDELLNHRPKRTDAR